MAIDGLTFSDIVYSKNLTLPKETAISFDSKYSYGIDIN